MSRAGTSNRSSEERGLELRRRLLLGGWVLAGLVLIGRATQLQVGQAQEWREAAERQHRTHVAIPAARGTIVDRDGVPLAVSRETYRIGVAPHELKDRGEVADLLSRTLDLGRREAQRITGSERRWVMIPGRFSPAVREVLSGVRGVYLERELQRFYPHGELARGILGTVSDEEGRGGIEQAYEAILAGRPGREVQARDNAGRPIPGESVLVEAPREGGTVRLTIDLDLQEIAHAALSEAVEETEAAGGDLLIADPKTGELLAMVSLKDGRSDRLTGINTPYEPGSTLKPFVVASILDNGVGSLADSVDTGNGIWTIHGRTLHDVHGIGRATLADALRESSNVGVAKAALPLTPGQQYQTLRDFGFGAPTGLPLPGENGGRLRRPEDWSRQSPQSLAIGYEIGVTPLQMTMAYGALANGGELMEPRLIREVLDGTGSVVERHQPRRVRRVVREGVTRAIRQVLIDVVEDGTGGRARLSTFEVAGKSGTARAYGPGGYSQGNYYSSFVGFFPAEDPQIVVYVKLEKPKGVYYGGATAAPVTRATLEGILAARQIPLDRRALARIARNSQAVQPAATGRRFVTARPVRPAIELPPVVPGTELTVPDVTELPIRTAVRRLHALGFRVDWSGDGDRVTYTLPAPGARLATGDTVRIHIGPGARPGRGDG